MERWLPGLVATRDGDCDDPPGTFPGNFAYDPELVMRQKTLQDDRSSFKLVTIHCIAGWTTRGSPYHRHRLNVLCTDGREELFHREARRRCTGQLSARPRCRRRGAGNGYGREHWKQRCGSEWSLHHTKP